MFFSLGGEGLSLWQKLKKIVHVKVYLTVTTSSYFYQLEHYQRKSLAPLKQSKKDRYSEEQNFNTCFKV